MPNMLEGKVAIVTGAGNGIGREIAVMMAAQGAKVIINDIGASVSGEGQDATPAQQTKAIIAQKGGQAEISTESVSSWTSAQKIVQAALEKHPLVKEFYDAPESHLGATVAVIRSS